MQPTTNRSFELSNKSIISNVNLVLPDRVVPGGLLVEDGVIAALAETPGPEFSGLPLDWYSGGAETLDGGGLYLSPGFIDLHNHGRLGFDAGISARVGGAGTSGGTAALENIARGQAEHGVTAFLAGISTLPWEQSLEAVRAAAAFCRKTAGKAAVADNAAGTESTAGADSVGARCLGIYFEGTFFSNEKRGAHNPRWLKQSIEKNDVEALLEAAGDTLKILALSPELPGAPEAVRLLRRKGITVSAAHSNAVYTEALAGIDAGITLSTHTFNGMRALSHQEPGILGAVLDDSRVYCELIADGIHLAKAILSLVYKLKGPDKIVLVSDSVAFNGLPPGRYEAEGLTVVVDNEGVIRLEDGRLAGSSLSLDRAVHNMIRLGGASLPEAVRMASLNPARILGLEQRKGSLETGKDADMVLFDENITVKKVFLG